MKRKQRSKRARHDKTPRPSALEPRVPTPVQGARVPLIPKCIKERQH